MIRLLLIIALLAPAIAEASKVKRSEAAKREFRSTHPCPGTGQKRGACPGYVIDHVVPLCAGGPDKATNMQWQTVEEGKAKDRIEVAKCRAMRKKTWAP